MHSAHS